VHPNELLLHHFYTCFQHRDADGMTGCYHSEVAFSDPAFGELHAMEPVAMWKMLLGNAKDMQVTFRDIQADEQQGCAHWEANYTFPTTGRRVQNVVEARFQFREEKILIHQDSFDYWKWASQALGLPGRLLGWTPWLHNKTQQAAREKLRDYMEQTGLPISAALLSR
jgi:hypothetical protein